MINIRYHPELIEKAVWLAARGDAARENELHRDVDPIFEIPAGEEREDRFGRVFASWFARLRLDQFLDEAVSHFPLIVHQLREGFVRAAARHKSEGAELFVRDNSAVQNGTLVIQICPESLIESETARDQMLRELQHVEDMLDASFAYVPETIEGLPSSQQVARERYRILWDIRVEALLVRRKLLGARNIARLRRRYECAFTLGGKQPPSDLFDFLWNQANGTHARFLEWAKDPDKWWKECGMPAHGSNRRSKGEPCPMCAFPTFDWYLLSGAEEERIVRRVRESKPQWNACDGICRQCAESILLRATVG